MAKQVKKHVEEILKNYPETRNSDKLLILKYWELVDKLPMYSMSRFKEAFLLNSTNTESIRRARQLIQEEGRYMPTKDSVVTQRRKKEVKMKTSIIEEREVV